MYCIGQTNIRPSKNLFYKIGFCIYVLCMITVNFGNIYFTRYSVLYSDAIKV